MRDDLLLEIWQRMQHTRSFSILFQVGTGEGGTGEGEVRPCSSGESCLLFEERGILQWEKGREIPFSNTYRWTLDRSQRSLALEHLRYGPAHPVFLTELTPFAFNSLEGLGPHLCGKDAYFASLWLHEEGFELFWKMIGPKKNDWKRSFYS